MEDIQPVHCIDAEMLIEEVKARPMLYTKEAAKYGDSNVKRDLWEEVARKLFENEWENLDNEERVARIHLTNRRWRNIRACFTREMRRQKDPKWIYGVAYKRRKYIYYNELLFLKNELEQTEGEDDGAHDIDVLENNGDDTKLTINTYIEETPIPDPVPIPVMPSVKCIKNEKSPEVKSNTAKENNEDSTNFALSLVPILNSLPMNRRIDAQIEILSILKRFYKDDNTIVTKAKSLKTYKKRKAPEISIEIKSEDDSEEDDQS